MSHSHSTATLNSNMEEIALTTPSPSTESLLLGSDHHVPSTSTAPDRNSKRQRADHSDPDINPSVGLGGLPMPSASATRLVRFAWERMTSDTTSNINNGKNNTFSSIVDNSNSLSNNASIVQNNDSLSKSVTIRPARFVPTMGNNQPNANNSLAVPNNGLSTNRNYVQTRLSFNNATLGIVADKSVSNDNNTNNTVLTSTTIRQ